MVDLLALLGFYDPKSHLSPERPCNLLGDPFAVPSLYGSSSTPQILSPTPIPAFLGGPEGLDFAYNRESILDLEIDPDTVRKRGYFYRCVDKRKGVFISARKVVGRCQPIMQRRVRRRDSRSLFYIQLWPRRMLVWVL